MHATASTTLRRTAILVIAAVLSACAGNAGAILPTSSASGAGQPGKATGGAIVSPIGARAIPIGARAIPIGARAIPIGARAIPINFTSLPKLLSVCGVPLVGNASCGAIRRLDAVAGLDLTAALIPGYQPADLQMAYNIPSGGGAGQTIAVVVAMNDPNAESDLAVYRSTFGEPACTSASGCLRIVGQNGTSALPRSDEGWGQELSIDLDVASAVCPQCRLLVVEANTPDIDDLTASVSTAVRLGATVVSNSYSTPETATVAAQDPLWNHPGVPIVAGAGDNGYGVGWPASSSHVTAVGGTTLLPVLADTFFLELAWGKTGSGCSAFIGKPSYQKDALCRHRTVNDVAAIADPVPGVSVYDTYFANPKDAGWNVYGGTSVSTPIVAGMYALAGDGATVADAARIYANPGALNNIILGSNALCLTYLCTSGLGYSGPTGLGSPNGVGAF